MPNCTIRMVLFEMKKLHECPALLVGERGSHFQMMTCPVDADRDCQE